MSNFEQANRMVDELWSLAQDINANDAFGSAGYAKLIGIYQSVITNQISLGADYDPIKGLQWGLDFLKADLARRQVKVEA